VGVAIGRRADDRILQITYPASRNLNDQMPVAMCLVRCALCFVLRFTDNRSLITDDYPATHNPNTLIKHDAPSTGN